MEKRGRDGVGWCRGREKVMGCWIGRALWESGNLRGRSRKIEAGKWDGVASRGRDHVSVTVCTVLHPVAIKNANIEHFIRPLAF